jgi:hypothetical protein
MGTGKGGVMERKATALALYEYFEALDPGNLEEADACAMHYGCACVVVRARQATRMLMDVMKAVGIDPAATATPAATAPATAPAAAPVAAPPAVDAAVLTDLNAQLEIARKHAQVAKDQMARLGTDNQRLRDHIRLMQRQLERLHDRREMSMVLGRLENSDVQADDAPGTRAEAPAPPAEPRAFDTSSPETAAPPAAPPSAPESAPAGPAKPKMAPATLAEIIQMEGAMPLPKDETSVDPSAVSKD